MGTATGSTSLLLGAGRNGAYIQRRTAPLPSWDLQLYGFYPFPIVVGQLERSCTGRQGRTGNLGVFQIRCSHNYSPDLCPILPTPKGDKGNRLDSQGEHIQVLGLLLISATGASVVWSRVAAWGMELQGVPCFLCSERCLCWEQLSWWLLLNYFPLGTIFTQRPYFYPGINSVLPQLCLYLKQNHEECGMMYIPALSEGHCCHLGEAFKDSQDLR